MKKELLILGLSAMVLVLSACAPPAEEEPAATEPAVSAEEAMRQLTSRWDEAQRSGEVDGLMALYVADGAAASPPDAPTARGSEAMRAVFGQVFGEGGNDVTDNVTAVVESGDVVVGRGTYVWNQTDESGAAMTETGKWLCLTRRQPDGSLLAVHNIWNRDAPPAGIDPLPPIADSGPAAAADAACLDSPMAIDQAFETDLEAGNVAALVAHHAEDGERLPPGMPAASGRDEVSRYLASRLAPFSERVLDLTDVVQGIEGDLGWTTGKFRFEYTQAEGGDAVTGEGTYMAVSQKGEDGCWRYKWVLWNYDAPWGET